MNPGGGADDSFYLYEETYGDAYVGGPIRYLYPSGYQSMRPRSCPWKISIAVCLLFTWLSVFIVGHCSDRVASASEEFYDSNGATAYYDDQFQRQAYILRTRWCGSRPLYWLWVTSMLVTGLAAAYCGVIGYIKVRDFAVANMRSQVLPPTHHRHGAAGPSPFGFGGDKYDHYVRIGDSPLDSYARGLGKNVAAADYYYNLEEAASSVAGTSASGSGSGHYRPSIYQSDGTPQFWGAHIYRPTQAAVAVASR
jgi:hypothetical protein